MTPHREDESSLAAWLDDFRACLAGAHGYAWRSRAEQELRAAGSAPASDRQRATAWRRAREEILSPPAA